MARDAERGRIAQIEIVALHNWTNRGNLSSRVWADSRLLCPATKPKGVRSAIQSLRDTALADEREQRDGFDDSRYAES